MAAQYFRVNSPTVIHETIDDEVIVANLDEGFYYSIDTVGVAIWNALDAGTSAARITDILIQHFGSQHTEMEQVVAAFITELEQEALIVPDPSRQEQDSAQVSLLFKNLPASFEKLSLQKYTDMQQLLLLDPIHEVDDTGWPNVVPEKVQEK